MPQIDVRDIDNSPAMKDFFNRVTNCLEVAHNIDRDTARHLVDRYFSIDVAPLERVFTMHNAAEDVAANLASAVPR